MSRWRCKGCKGEYSDPLPDGTRYFHACPPIVDPETNESKLRPKHRDERPQDVGIYHGPSGYTMLRADGTALKKSPTLPTAPIIAEGAGRESVS